MQRPQKAGWRQTDSKDVSDSEPDEIRHMMCPSNPPVHQDSTNTPAFFLCLVFTSVSCCNTVSAWSCLVWPTVSLFCLSGKGLAWRFHALFSVSPFLPLSVAGYSLRILSLFIFDCLCIPLTFAHITLSCSCFLPRTPFIFKFSFMSSLFIITLSHPPSLLHASPSISGSPCCLLGLVSCHLCRRT